MNLEEKIDNVGNGWNGSSLAQMFGTEMEIGKWYKKENNFGHTIFQYNGKKGNDANACGFSNKGVWHMYGVHMDDWATDPASDAEVEKLLTKEAIKRGYVNNKVRLIEGYIDLLSDRLTNKFFMKNGRLMVKTATKDVTVFYNGIWAEIWQPPVNF